MGRQVLDSSGYEYETGVRIISFSLAREVNSLSMPREIRGYSGDVSKDGNIYRGVKRELGVEAKIV